MDEKDFKKLLIDLDLTLTEVGVEAGIGYWAVTRYFRGELASSETRSRIKRFLVTRARQRGIDLPPFWEDVAA